MASPLPPPFGGRTAPGGSPVPLRPPITGREPVPHRGPPELGTGGGGGLDPGQQSAYDVLVAMLREWGLESLAPDVLRLLQEGRSLDQVSLLLQDTDTYKQRFQGNEVRRRQGMPVLSPREYLSVEAAYRQIMESAGLPVGFYDSPDDFAAWIGNDVSPSEISSRVGEAQASLEEYERNNPGTVWAFREFYGVTAENVVAHFLDRERWDINKLKQVARAARIGGAGFREGLGLSRDRAEQLALSTLVSDAEIAPAVGRVATLATDIGKLGSVYGEDYGAGEAADEVFLGSEQSRRKRQRLAGREVSEFSGSSGVGKGSLSQAPASY